MPRALRSFTLLVRLAACFLVAGSLGVMALACDPSSAEAASGMAAGAANHSDAVLQWLYRGGSANPATTPACASVCQQLWAAEHARGNGSVDDQVFHRQVQLMRARTLVVSSFREVGCGTDRGLCTLPLVPKTFTWKVGSNTGTQKIVTDELPGASPDASWPTGPWTFHPVGAGDTMLGAWNTSIRAPSDGYRLSIGSQPYWTQTSGGCRFGTPTELEPPYGFETVFSDWVPCFNGEAGQVRYEMLFRAAGFGAPVDYTNQTYDGWSPSINDPGALVVSGDVKTQLTPAPTGYAANYGEVIPWLEQQLAGVPPDSLFLGVGSGDDSATSAKAATCGDPVDCRTGNFSEHYTDLHVGGLGVGLNLTRTYNSASAATGQTGPFGPGWTFNFGQSLSADSASGVVTVTHSDGASVSFTPTDAGHYATLPLVHSTLFKRADGSYAYTLPDHRVFSFTDAGRLSNVADQNGNSTSLEYAAAGRLATITDPVGRALTLTYNADGTIDHATDPGGRVVRYFYVGGELRSVTDVGGYTTQFVYDSSHRMRQVTDPRSHTVVNTFDSSNRVHTQTDRRGHVMTWDYATDQTTITGPSGNITEERFAGNLLTSITHAKGTSDETTTTYGYDGDGQRTRMTDGRGNEWRFGYDNAGNRSSVKDPLGHETTYVYDADRNLTSITLASGRVTEFGHADGHNNLTSVTGIDSGPDPDRRLVTTLEYNALGELEDVTDPLHHVTHYDYNPHGDRTAVTTATGHKTTMGHDDESRLTSMVSARGNEPGAVAAQFTTTFTPDAFGRVVDITDPLGHHALTHYDANGNVDSQTDRNHRETGATYNANDQQTELTRPDGTVQHTGYDVDGHVESQTDPLGQATTYGYDHAGRLKTSTDPQGRETRYGYDANSNQTSGTDPAGRVTTTTFDTANRPTLIHYSSGHPGDAELHYNADNQVAWTTGDSGTSTNTYDALGQLHDRTDGAGKTITYTYNDAAQITKITYPTLPGSGEGGDVTRTYDDAGNLASVKDWHGRTTTFTPNADEQLETTTFPTGSNEVDTSVYDRAGRLDSITDTASGATLARFGYHHDDVGRVTQAATSGTALSGLEDYGFDSLGRLTSANDQTYDHTTAGALTSLDSVTGAGYDSAGQLTGATVDGGATTYGYDTNGQRTTSKPLNGGATTYAYDQAGKLSAVHPARQTPANAAGWYHGLAVDTDGTTHAWGLNNFGQVVNGASTQAFPVTVVGLANITAVAAGAAHSLALNRDGRVYSWGNNTYGQLGSTPGTGRSVPARIQGLSSIKQLSAGAHTSMALDAAGEVYSWGWNAHGQLADATTTDSGTPQHIAGLPAVKQIVSSYKNGFALDATGSVWAWGANDKRQLSDTTTTERHAPIHVQGLPANIKQIACEQDFAIALDADGHVWLWGIDFPTPIILTGVSNITQISAGAGHVVALNASGHVYVLGNNDWGQYGNATTTTSANQWQQVPGLADATAVSAGLAHNYALKADGTIMAWGYNGEGEAGNGQTGTIVTTPVTVDSLTLQVPQHTSTYTYDASGLRTSKTIGTATTRYTWDAQTGELPLMLADTQHQYIYGPGDQPIEQIAADGRTTYLHQDQLGSTRLVTNTDGTTVGTATYTPYGTVASQTGITSALGYAGQYTDPDTGLIYMRARDYDPATGQFLTRDPLEAFTRDAYGYAGKDPINYSDPSGLWFAEVAGGIVAGAEVIGGAALCAGGGCEAAAVLAGAAALGAGAGYLLNEADDSASDSASETDNCPGLSHRRSSPFLEDDPYSPESVARRQSERRREAGVNADPDTSLPDRGPGRDRGGHGADATDAHPTGERNVGSQEHSRVAKGSGGRGPRGR